MGIFREFGIPEFSGYRNFRNSVFPFGIAKFSVFPCMAKQKNPTNSKKNLFFFPKVMHFWNSRAFSGSLCIFGISVRFQNSRAFSYHGKFQFRVQQHCLFSNLQLKVSFSFSIYIVSTAKSLAKKWAKDIPR